MRVSRLFGIRRLFSMVVAMAAFVGAAAANPADDYVYAVRSGDTVIGLSQRLLKDPAQWRDVASYNRMPNPNQISPRQQVRIPLEFLRTGPAAATLASVEGDVKVSTGAGVSSSVAALGASLAEGAEVVTGKNGYATLKLADGSTVRVQSGTQMQVSRLRSYPDAGILESALSVVVGRVESLIAKFTKDSATQPRHSVNTRLAAMGVRGTEFRVTMDAQTNETTAKCWRAWWRQMHRAPPATASA